MRNSVTKEVSHFWSGVTVLSSNDLYHCTVVPIKICANIHW